MPEQNSALSTKMREVVAIDGESIAVEFGGQSYPWSFIQTAVAQLDSLCADHQRGAARGIAVVLRNRPWHVAAVAATVAGGRSLLTLSPFHGDIGLAEDIEALRPAVVAADSEDWVRAGFVEAVQAVGALGLELSKEGPIRLRAGVALPTAPPDPSAEAALAGTAVLMMTSGTTGRPKRVPLSYEHFTTSLENSATGAGPSIPAKRRDRTDIVWTPMVHIGGLFFIVVGLLEGKTIALLERFAVEPWMELVRQHRPVIVSLVPTALKMVLDANVPVDVFEGVRAARSGTAPLDPAVAAEFERRYSIPVLTNYGATEFAGAVTRWTLKEREEWGNRKTGSVGRAAQGVEMRVADAASGAIVGPGEIGILHVRGGQVPPADGDGWTRTSDLASIDADGFLYIHGRADDAVIRGGFKIVPSVVEEALRTHPSVADAAVTGLAHPRLGAVPVAAVTLRPATEAPTEAALLEWVTSRLARYQVPVAVKVVEALPRTPSMKVSRPALKALFDGLELRD